MCILYLTEARVVNEFFFSFFVRYMFGNQGRNLKSHLYHNESVFVVKHLSEKKTNNNTQSFCNRPVALMSTLVNRSVFISTKYIASFSLLGLRQKGV